MKYLILYFVAGIVQDFLFTLNVRAIDERRTFLAALTSFFTVFVGMVILYNIISRLNAEQSLMAIGVYCLGIALGTALGMKYHLKRRRPFS